MMFVLNTIHLNYELCKNALFFTINQSITGKKILFCAVYIEPDNSKYFNRQAYNELQTNLLQKLELKMYVF